MKTDMYTKVILTVIALALTINLIKDFNLVSTAQAAVAQIPEPKRHLRDTIDVNIVQLNGQDMFIRSLKVKEGGERAVLPISLEYEDLLNTLQVSFSSSSPIPVDITHVNGYSIQNQYGSTLPVSVVD